MVTTDHEIAVPQSSGTSLAGSLAAFAWRALVRLRHPAHLD
jgi:hypothetical protein